MTQYNLRVTIAAPADMLDDCNALALCLGESPADINTFTRATHTDAEGNEYSVASTVAKPVFTEMAASELVAPTYAPDMDLEAAGRAQALLNFEQPVVPGKMNVFVGERWDRVGMHLHFMGLEPIPPEEGS